VLQGAAPVSDEKIMDSSAPDGAVDMRAASVTEGPTDRDRVGGLDGMLGEWTRRVGPEAAAHRVTYYRAILHAWVAGTAGFALVVAGAGTRTSALEALGGALLLGWSVLYVRAWSALRRMNVAAGRAIGVTIRFSHGPPAGRDRYERWCEVRALTPFPFPDAVPPAVRTRWF
jgi:hypothetical protein